MGKTCFNFKKFLFCKYNVYFSMTNKQRFNFFKRIDFLLFPDTFHRIYFCADSGVATAGIYFYSITA
jgi:hypothetical protein